MAVFTSWITLLVLLTLGGECLKISPPRYLARSPINKRQASGSSGAPSTTTVVAPNPLVTGGASTCVCRLIQPFANYVTITSDYYGTGTSTTTLAQPSGTTPGTVEILTPISQYITTTTITSGSVGYTSTFTTTGPNGTPSSVVVIDQPVPLCGNQGWQWAYAQIPAYDHGFRNDFNYSSLQCSANYIYQDTTDTIYIQNGPANAPNTPAPVVPGYYYNFYGKYNAAIAPAAINHRGFFIAPYTGAYTFSIRQADDEAAIWLGDNAVTNWNNNNSIAESSFLRPNQTSQPVQMDAGTCTPIRVAWIDGSAPGGLSISIRDSNGNNLDGTNYIRDTCCNSAVTYAAFGNECATRPTLATTTLHDPEASSYTSTVYTSTVSGNPTQVVVVNAPIASQTGSLGCNATAYFISTVDGVVSLYNINLATGSTIIFASNVGGGTYTTINGMGFNPLDNFLYAVGTVTAATSFHSGTYAVIRLTSSGQINELYRFSTPTDPSSVGDFDANGQFYFSGGGLNWYQMDLAPGSSNYATIVDSGNSALNGYTLYDWAYVGSQPGYLWSVGVSSNAHYSLLRWSLTDHVWSVYQDYPNTNAQHPKIAAWGGNNGSVWGFAATSGDITRIDIGGSLYEESIGPTGITGGDGARCAFAN